MCEQILKDSAHQNNSNSLIQKAKRRPIVAPAWRRGRRKQKNQIQFLFQYSLQVVTCHQLFPSDTVPVKLKTTHATYRKTINSRRAKQEH